MTWRTLTWLWSIGMERYMLVYICRSKFNLEEKYACGYFCHNINTWFQYMTITKLQYMLFYMYQIKSYHPSRFHFKILRYRYGVTFKWVNKWQIIITHMFIYVNFRSMNLSSMFQILRFWLNLLLFHFMFELDSFAH